MKTILLLLLMIFSAQLASAECSSFDDLENERQEIYETISVSQACETDNDCELLSLGCPIGCSTPVNKESSTTIVALAKSYHDKACYNCEFKCQRHTSSICIEKKCVQK